jgi:hypothetical protein
MVAKSCTNWYVVYPPICRVSTIQGGAWFRNHPQYVVSQTWDGIGMASLIIFDRWYSHFTIGPYTVYIYINRYIYIHTQSPFWYGIFCLVWLRLDYTQPSPISHIPSAECPQKSLCDSPQNCPRIPKTAICGLSEPNSFGEVVAGSTGKIPGLDDHECIAGSRMWCYTFILPRCSMYGIFTNICPKNHPNVGKYTIHGAYGLYIN